MPCALDRDGSLRDRVARVMLRDLPECRLRRRPIVTRPHVVLVVGVNGTGKTTTVGKLANLHREAGRSVMVCAADTFRAAAVEQLAVWTERAGVDLVRAQSGADPAAVTFDAVSAAKARGQRRRDRRHRRTSAHAREPDGRARQDPPRRRPRSARRPARSAARARRDGRAERARAGPRVHGGERRQRHRADQARRHGEGRRRRGDRARSQAADPLHRRRRRPSTIWCRSIRRPTSTRCSPTSGDARATIWRSWSARCSSPSAGAGARRPIRSSAPWSCRRTASSSGRARISVRADRTRRSSRSIDAGDRARGAHALLHARAVQSHRAHAVRASSASSRPASAASSRPPAI